MSKTEPKSAPSEKERKFFEALKDIFVGAKVEGESGFINLMRIKSAYFEHGIYPKLLKNINESLEPFPDFREELFEKLYTFFNRYFSESGSVYFTSTPVHQNIYEKIYTDDKDVILFWKTRMLYYVKSDRLFKNLEATVDGFEFLFDVSELEHKKANEKREISYEFKEKRDDGKIIIMVHYSEKGKKTKIEEIQKALEESGLKVAEETIARAFKIFNMQNEVDYFINKNTKEFLREQFNLWLHQYIFAGGSGSEWNEKRIKELQILEDIAHKFADFISQFEDELVRIWNKPKFVLSSNYVLTLDRIATRNFGLLEKLLNHPKFDEQIKEWKDLGFVDEDFNKNKITKNSLSGKILNEKYKFLPCDTKYFKSVETDILALFEDLDKALDGWLIKSENFQALNTILPKFKTRVPLIYIDPPFNKEQDADYCYSIKYKDATWVTILENRIQLAKSLLGKNGSIYVKCDYNGNMLARLLMNEIFGPDNFRSEIIWKRLTATKVQKKHLAIMTDTIYCYSKTSDWVYHQQYRPYSKRYIKTQFKYSDEKESMLGKHLLRNFYSMGSGPPRMFWGRMIPPPEGHHWRFAQKNIDDLIADNRIVPDKKGFPKLKMYLKESKGIPYNNLLTKFHVIQGSSSESWDFPTQNPETLLKTLILSSSDKSDIVMDFFLGSGTTAAVAHKLGRKWIGVEMGDYFYSKDLPRMKKVLAGDQAGISEEVNWKGGGFFKYYEIEQYEDALRKVKYVKSETLEGFDEDPYNQYIFLKDPKMLDAVEIDYSKNKVNVDLGKLYSNIDIPETLSNLAGKWIKRINPDSVEYEDGEKVDIINVDYKIVKQLIWW